jgi:hypothetical protein
MTTTGTKTAKHVFTSAAPATTDRATGDTPSATRLAPIALIDEILETHRDALGNAFTGYRNHAQRVALTCGSLASLDDTQREQIHVAAAFHDLAIWTHSTFDYLAPSIGLARDYLAGRGQESWLPQVAALIDDHHRLLRPRHAYAELSDVFRRADLIDVVRSHAVCLRAHPLPGLMQAFPSAGFHALLVKLTARQFLRTPWNPLPVVRW